MVLSEQYGFAGKQGTTVHGPPQGHLGTIFGQIRKFISHHLGAIWGSLLHGGGPHNPGKKDKIAIVIYSREVIRDGIFIQIQTGVPIDGGAQNRDFLRKIDNF